MLTRIFIKKEVGYPRKKKKKKTNFQTEASKLFAAVANCSEQVVNQNTNVAAEVCKVAQKRTSGLTVIGIIVGYSLHLQHGQPAKEQIPTSSLSLTS